MNDLNKELFERILLDPAIHKGASYLKIVSGYSSSSMVRMHIECLRRKGKKVTIELIVGMPPKQGIEKKLHDEFKDLEKEFSGQFKCYYIKKEFPAVHAKTYCWLSEQGPLIAFSGSANYSWNGFSRNQIEKMNEVNADDMLSFYFDMRKRSIDCCTHNIENMVSIVDTDQCLISDDTPTHCRQVKLTLLSANGEEKNPPENSGINLGCGEGSTNPNNANIRVPAILYRLDFFPKKDRWFSVNTDDGEKFKMKIVSGKKRNSGFTLVMADRERSFLGKYFRKRIGVPSGTRVTGDHLDKYGRNDVTFVKFIDGSYLLDFSVRNNTNI